MATITFERNTGSTGAPTWTSLGANILHFTGSATSSTAPISTVDWNDGTHSAASDGGTDNCTTGPYANHTNNSKYVAAGTVSLNGAGALALNDTNVPIGNCVLRLHVNNAVSVQTQNSRFFAFDGTTDTAEAVGVECYVWERSKGVAQTTWFLLNDDSTNVGGDNASEFQDLDERGAAIDNFWYVILSARGETAGPKASFDFKMATEVF